MKDMRPVHAKAVWKCSSIWAIGWPVNGWDWPSIRMLERAHIDRRIVLNTHIGDNIFYALSSYLIDSAHSKGEINDEPLMDWCDEKNTTRRTIFYAHMSTCIFRNLCTKKKRKHIAHNTVFTSISVHSTGKTLHTFISLRIWCVFILFFPVFFLSSLFVRSFVFSSG